MNHYDAAYLAAGTFLLPVIAHERWRHGKYRRSLPGMFGANLPQRPLPERRERVWLHSVSFGETIGAGSVFRLLRERFPQWEYLSTTTTETGHDQAKRSLEQADYHDFAPVDLSWTVRKFLDAYRPSVYLFFETEFWPNRLMECGRRGVKSFLVNGGVSERSARKYRLFRSLSQSAGSNVTAFLVQTEAHAERIRSMLGENVAIHVTGNVKFDSLPQPLSAGERTALRGSWGIADEALLLLAGSTHPGEEKLIYTSFRRLRDEFPNARLIIAPRNPERFGAVVSELGSCGAAVHRLSVGSPPHGSDAILVLDQMGVLAKCFGAADLALVGGAWNPIGGHNLLEPAAHAIPVIHGPHMFRQLEILRIMTASGASVEVSGEGLAQVMIDLGRDVEKRRALGERGFQAAKNNAGAAQRTVDILSQYLDPAAGS